MPDGLRWVGLDVHARESTIAVFDQGTGELSSGRVVGRPRAGWRVGDPFVGNSVGRRETAGGAKRSRGGSSRWRVPRVARLAVSLTLA